MALAAQRNNPGNNSLGLRVAIAGASGNVGRQFFAILRERRFPLRALTLLASRERLERFAGALQRVEALDGFDFGQCELAFFAVDKKLAARFAPRAAKAGCTVIDNSAHFRLHDSVKLVIPEVNGEELAECRRGDIIANPNCSTAQLLCVLKPLHEAAGIRQAIVATYQSVSGAGRSEMDELKTALAEGEAHRPKLFPKNIAGNVIPHIDAFAANGFTGEENKIAAETGKILDPAIRISASCVRVPVMIGHGQAVHLALGKTLSPEKAREILAAAPGVEVMDERCAGGYATPLDAAGKDAVFVSRLRADPALDNGLALWIAADNLRKGAALNAVQIAEHLIARGLFAAAPAFAAQR